MKIEPPSRDLAPLPVAYPLAMPAPIYSSGPPPLPGPPQPSALLTLADHLLQHAGLFAGVFLAVLVLGLAYLVLVPPVYRAETLVQIDSRGPRTLATSVAQVQANPEGPLGFVQGELEILRSRDILSKAIEQTRADVEIEVASRLPLLGNTYARAFGRNASEPLPPPLDLPLLNSYSWGGEQLRVAQLRVPRLQYAQPLTLVAGPNGRWTLLDESDNRLAEGSVEQPVAFRIANAPALLQVSALRALPGTRFTVIAHDPAAVYDDFARNLKIEEAGRQSGVIRVSLNAADPRFAAAFLDRLTSAYLAHHISVHASEANKALEFLEGQLPGVKRELDRAEEALNRYRTGANTINVSQENEAALRRMTELERQRVELELRRQQIAQRYTGAYPEAQSLQRQLGMVSGELTRLRSQMRQTPQQEKDVVRLQRDVQVSTQLYTALLNNAQELRVARAGMAGNARLVDAAGVVSKPVRPVPMLVLSVSLALGLLAALASVLLARTLRPTIRSAEDLEQQIGLPTLASVPESANQAALIRSPKRGWRTTVQPRLLALRSPSDPAIESLRSLRNHIAIGERDGGRTSVLITAPTANAGKSFVAANLAVLTAAAGRRVLLIDLDMRAQRLHAYFGVDRDRPDIVDLVAERCSLDEAIVRDVLPGMDLLLPGRVFGSPGELLMQPRFEAMMNELTRLYSHVVVDSAPVLPVGDTLAIGRLVQTTYLVVRSELNSVREVRDSMRRLESAGVGVDGLILNGVKRGRLGSMQYRSYFTPVIELRSTR